MFDVAELFGYIASFFVAISLLMSSFIWLRVLNLIGAVAFVMYGTLLGSIPVVITNAFITVINVYYLVRMFRPDLNGITYVPVGSDRRGQLDDFVAYYLDDILKFFPDFSTGRIDESFSSGGLVYLALKDLRLVGFALVHPVPAAESEEPLSQVYRYIHDNLFPSRSAVLSVDYIIRKYRGLGLVHRLYDAIEQEEGDRLSFLLAPVGRDASRHRKFLIRHGYELQKSFQQYDLYVKGIAGGGPH
jgi:hypothetical protein